MFGGGGRLYKFGMSLILTAVAVAVLLVMPCAIGFAAFLTVLPNWVRAAFRADRTLRRSVRIGIVDGAVRCSAELKAWQPKTPRLPLAIASLAAVVTVMVETVLFSANAASADLWLAAGGIATLIALPAPFALAAAFPRVVRRLIAAQIDHELRLRFGGADEVLEQIFRIIRQMSDTYAAMGLRLHAGAAELCREAVLRQAPAGRRAGHAALVRLRDELQQEWSGLEGCVRVYRTAQAEFDRAYERMVAAGRTVELDELSRIQAWFGSPELASHLEAARWDEAQAWIHQIRFEIGRIRQAVAYVDEIPRSPEEAYRVLNVSRDAPKKVIKSVVDALRRAWHPDLAANDEDRERRTSKMQQINAAWDLLESLPVEEASEPL